MFELMIMTEEMKKKLDPDAYSCAIDKSANIIVWKSPTRWSDCDEDFYSRFYIAKNYIKIAYFRLIHNRTSPNNSEFIVPGDEVIYNWSIISFEKYDTCTYKYSELLEILKEGLTTYGKGVQINESHPDFTVTFDFQSWSELWANLPQKKPIKHLKYNRTCGTNM